MSLHSFSLYINKHQSLLKVQIINNKCVIEMAMRGAVAKIKKPVYHTKKNYFFKKLIYLDNQTLSSLNFSANRFSKTN